MVDQKRVLGALILLYTGIDIVASLERHPAEGTKASFVRWVNGFLFKGGLLECTAIELYGARCGILHSFSADSDLSRGKGVRRVVYGWGSSSIGDIQEATRRLGKQGIVAVHLNDLREAFQEGVISFLEAVAADERRAKAVAAKAGEWLVNMDQELVRAFLDRTCGQADA